MPQAKLEITIRPWVEKAHAHMLDQADVFMQMHADKAITHKLIWYPIAKEDTTNGINLKQLIAFIPLVDCVKDIKLTADQAMAKYDHLMLQAKINIKVV